MINVQLLLGLGLRMALGVGVAIVLSSIGIVVAWGLFLFSGVQSVDALLWTLIIGAGLGAGLGGFAAWLRLEGDTRPALLAMATLAVAAGVGGAWGGYEFGSSQEVECCAMPKITPVTYTVMGAIVVTNVAVTILGLAREAKGRWRGSGKRKSPGLTA